MKIRLVDIGPVSIEELEARLSAYLNAGAPEPILEGTSAECREILKLISERGDNQMKSLVNHYLKKLETENRIHPLTPDIEPYQGEAPAKLQDDGE